MKKRRKFKKPLHAINWRWDEGKPIISTVCLYFLKSKMFSKDKAQAMFDKQKLWESIILSDRWKLQCVFSYFLSHVFALLASHPSNIPTKGRNTLVTFLIYFYFFQSGNLFPTKANIIKCSLYIFLLVPEKIEIQTDKEDGVTHYH